MSMDSAHQFRFSYSAADAKILLGTLFGFELLLTTGYILIRVIAPGFPWGPLQNFFDVDREVSIPTWFSSIQLFAIAAVLLMQAPRAKQLRFPLLILGLGFLFLSMDEAAAIHDSIYRSVQRLKLERLHNREFLVWMVLYLCVALIGLLLAYRSVLFAWRNFRREFIVVALGGALFVGGGIVIESLTHYLYRIAVDARFFLAVAAEELFEMAGASVMLYGFLLLGITIQSHSST
jgi:hypothetical protein